MRRWRSDFRGFVPLATLLVLGLAFALADALFGCERRAPRVERVEWPVMGTVAAIQWRGGAAPDRARVAAAYEAVTREFNAYDSASSIRRLATSSDAELRAYAATNAVFGACYDAAFRLAEWTGNVFSVRWRGPGTLDFGAIAKGFAVDLAAESLAGGGAAGDALLDLGGNLKSVRGTWLTGVLGPDGTGVCATVELREGEALATSASYFRGRHIRDGRTGLAVSNGVASVTVLCGSAMWADGLSTSLFVLGPEAGAGLLAAHGAAFGEVAALWVMDDGRREALDPAHRFEIR